MEFIMLFIDGIILFTKLITVLLCIDDREISLLHKLAQFTLSSRKVLVCHVSISYV